MREITKAIKAMSEKKAAGFDEIPAKFIKEIGVKLVRPITLLFRCILENTFPNQMKKIKHNPLV